MRRGDSELRAEYTRADFGRLERGKFYPQATQGATVVLLEPRIAKAFPTSAAVNQALRSLLALTEETAKLTSRAGTRATRRRTA